MSSDHLQVADWKWGIRPPPQVLVRSVLVQDRLRLVGDRRGHIAKRLSRLEHDDTSVVRLLGVHISEGKYAKVHVRACTLEDPPILARFFLPRAPGLVMPVSNDVG
jgi:hypothetical protein